MSTYEEITFSLDVDTKIYICRKITNEGAEYG